jgi:hypothetical protein
MLQGGAKQWNVMLAFALEPNIMVNSISMCWQHVSLPLKSCVVDVHIKLLSDVTGESC